MVDFGVVPPVIAVATVKRVIVETKLRCKGAGLIDYSNNSETMHCLTCLEIHHVPFTGGNPPVSLFEVTFDGYGNIDYYDISLVDGYNLPIRVDLVPGTFQ